MFAEMFKALKRIFDNTFAPLLMGVLAVVMELAVGGLTWVGVKIADLILWLISSVLGLFDFSSVDVDLGVFGQQFFELMELMGVWDALLFYFGGVVVLFVLKVVTVGVIGKK